MILIGLLILMLLPFLSRPFFIDDYYHFLMAKGILEHPLRPYDFLADDAGPDNAGWERGKPPRMVNPPLTHYYLAGVIKLFGDKERTLHASFMLFSLMSVVSMYFLSGTFVKNHIFATLLFMVNPVFWITSNGFMLDSPKLSFYLLSLTSLVYGLKNENKPLLFTSGIAMSLSLLSKYTAISLLPVAFIYMFLSKKDWHKYLWIFLIPLAALFFWSFWNIIVYGAPHMLAASRRAGPSSYLMKLSVILIFLSGSTIFLIGAFFLLVKNRLFIFLAPPVFLFIGLLLSSERGGFSLTQSFLISFWLLASASFFYALFLNAGVFSGRNGLFLIIWFSLAIFIAIFAMGWTSGRYFMSVISPLSLMFVKIVENKFSEKKTKLFLAATLVVTFTFGALLAYTDYVQANVNKNIADDLKSADVPPGFFKGESFVGVTAYLKENGWHTTFPNSTLRPGDLFLEGTISSPTVWLFPPKIEGKLRLVKEFKYKTMLPFRVMSVPDSAGFYATCWGALPWSISELPLERYKLYVVEKI